MNNASGKTALLVFLVVAMFLAGCSTSATTPLMDAAMVGDTEKMKGLIGAGARLEESTYSYEYTALHQAVYKNQLASARLLVEKGAEVDKRAKFWGEKFGSHWICDCTPLYLAVLNGDTNMVALLLEKGASPTVSIVAGDETETTPYKAAQAQGNIAVVEMFKKSMGIVVPVVVATPIKPATPVKVTKPIKAPTERLVLMPLRVGEDDKSLEGAMETALAQGLQQNYVVFSGEQVAQKAHEIFLKESRSTAKKECDETRCMQGIAEAFQAELIATANVTKRDGGYFLALSIRNIFDNKVVYSNSVACKGCDTFQVVDKLKELSGI